ncbi:MAG TPA: glycosyltransferase [Thermogutta sp.]|nr:glycosyltransferase [Thermogutta sp.]
MSIPDVSFVIPTRNRPDILVPCVRACLAQKDISAEILVYDDASDEDMRPILIRAFGDRARVTRFESNLGQPEVRTIGYQEARGRYIVSLDDDTLLFDPLCVARARDMMDSAENIGAVALRYYERPGTPGTSKYASRVGGEGTVECSSFTGAVVVLKRSAVIEAGCYPEWIYRQGEERFLSIRLLDLGYRIVMAGPPSAIHLYSPVRNRSAMSWYGIRNALLFDWICVPHPYFLPYLAKDIVKLFLYKITLANIPRKCAAIAWGLTSMVQKWSLRRPVSREAFRKYLALPRHGPIALPMDWSAEPLVSLGIIQSVSDLDLYLKPEKAHMSACSSR